MASLSEAEDLWDEALDFPDLEGLLEVDLVPFALGGG